MKNVKPEVGCLYYFIKSKNVNNDYKKTFFITKALCINIKLCPGTMDKWTLYSTNDSRSQLYKKTIIVTFLDSDDEQFEQTWVENHQTNGVNVYSNRQFAIEELEYCQNKYV